MFGWFRKKRVDPVDGFIRHIAQHRPQWQVRSVKSNALVIRLGPSENEMEVDINPDRIRAMADGADEDSLQCKAAYAQLVAILDNALASGGPLSLDAVRARLRPRLMTDEYNQQLKRGPMPVARRMPELGFWLVCAIDSEESVSFVSEKQLTELAIDEDKLHAIALENLASQQFRDVVRSVVSENKAVNFKMLDSYDAARLLLIPNCLNEGEQIAAVIPDRDTLFMCPVPANADWNALADIAKAPFSDRLILDRPVCVSRAGFELR